MSGGAGDGGAGAGAVAVAVAVAVLLLLLLLLLRGSTDLYIPTETPDPHASRSADRYTVETPI